MLEDQRTSTEREREKQGNIQQKDRERERTARKHTAKATRSSKTREELNLDSFAEKLTVTRNLLYLGKYSRYSAASKQ